MKSEPVNGQRVWVKEYDSEKWYNGEYYYIGRSKYNKTDHFVEDAIDGDAQFYKYVTTIDPFNKLREKDIKDKIADLEQRHRS
jgi:hypothetical protein